MNYLTHLEDCRARLFAAEQERDQWREACLAADGKTLSWLLGAEARAQAAEQALRLIADKCEEGDRAAAWRPNIVSIARAALAGREETT